MPIQRNYTFTGIARLCMLIICLGLGLFVASAQAVTIAPGDITGSSSGMYPGYMITDVYDGSGLIGNSHNGGDVDCAVHGPYQTRTNVGDHFEYTPTAQYNAGTTIAGWWMAFEFDHAYALDNLDIWNMGGWFNTGGYNSVVIETSTTGGTSTSDWSTAFTGNLTQAPNTDPFTGPTNTIDMGDVSAKYVVISALSNHGYSNNAYAGLAELQFVTTSPPSPDLDITVGSPTQLTTLKSTGLLSVSRTGVAAAFYQEPTGAMVCRTSTDKGLTWGPAMGVSAYPGPMSVGLSGGGVVSVRRFANPVGGGSPPVTSDLESTRILYSDDFSQFSTSTVPVTIPNAVMNTAYASFWPCWEKGKIVQLDNGDLLAPIFGTLLGDVKYRTMLMKSTDQGQSWQYRSTVAYSATDPDPELSGTFAGYCEPSITLLANGQLLAMLRTQGSQFEPYRPMYVAWSDDLGLTWTQPEPTDPHLLNVWPTLMTLDNGVVACEYGRPGVHVAFSTDNGHTWSDIETFSTIGTPGISGYEDLVQVGPNELLVTAAIDDGVYVWPIRVDLAGDVDGDGFVGGDDLTIILTNWGSSGMTREQGDLTGDSFIGGDDYSEVLTYWGTGIGLGAVLSSVPEPLSLILLTWGGLIVLLRRRRSL